MEDRGATDGFAVGRGAPAVSGLVVTLHRQEVPVLMALWHEDGSSWANVAAAAVVGAGLQGLRPGQLALGLTRI